MEWAGYEYAYMFKYSERPGTMAARQFKDDVAEETKSKSGGPYQGQLLERRLPSTTSVLKLQTARPLKGNNLLKHALLLG